MSDLISRQAAIDEIRRWIGYIDEDMITRIQIGLKKLPSAEPVRKPDEWCVDCKEYDHEKNCCPRFNRVIKSALNDAEPEISRIEQELHGKTPEEQYDFIYWLLFKSFEATAYSNSRLAIIEWLRGDKG